MIIKNNITDLSSAVDIQKALENLGIKIFHSLNFVEKERGNPA